ncbi:MAG: YtxH domain-containing protein [Peptostreptococcaceae bacterium]
MSNKKGRYLFFGAIIGLLAGLFFAPKKGSELRQEAKEKIDEVKENPQEVLHGTINVVRDKISNLIEDNKIEDEIKISEDEIIISKTFDNEGEI